MQTVLNQREREEELAKQTFAEAEAAFQRGAKLLDELREVRAALIEELSRQRNVQNFNPAETQLYHEYMQTIMQSIREQEDFVRKLAINKEAFKLSMISASQNRQVLDQVKDRHKKAHNLEAQRTQQVQIDEMASSRYNYQRAQENQA